jgi:fatty-acyl-CoA synthase
MVYPADVFDTKATLEAISIHKCSFVLGVPTMFIALLSEYDKNKSKYDISSISGAVVGASDCPEVLMKRIHDELGAKRLTTGLAMTETAGPITICGVQESLQKKAITVGKPMANIEIKLVDPNSSQVVPWGEVGEILIKGFNVMKGYWDN